MLLFCNIFIIAFAHKSTGVNSIACFNAYSGNAPIFINDFILEAKAFSDVFIWNLPSEYLLTIFPILNICASKPFAISSNIILSASNFVIVYTPFRFCPT